MTTELRLIIDDRKLQQAFDQAPQNLIREIGYTIGRIVQEMARTAKRKAPKASSTLTNAIAGIQPTSLEGLVVAGVNYARIVEEGSGVYGDASAPSGRRPPLSRIEDWIRVKRIQPRDASMTTRDLAWMIAAKIARSGTPSQPFMGPAYEQHAITAIRRINQAIARALR